MQEVEKREERIRMPDKFPFGYGSQILWHWQRRAWTCLSYRSVFFLQIRIRLIWSNTDPYFEKIGTGFGFSKVSDPVCASIL